jgi:hypothetical protein
MPVAKRFFTRDSQCCLDGSREEQRKGPEKRYLDGVINSTSCGSHRARIHLSRPPHALRIVAAAADGSQVALALERLLRSTVEAPHALMFRLAQGTVLNFVHGRTLGTSSWPYSSPSPCSFDSLGNFDAWTVRQRTDSGLVRHGAPSSAELKRTLHC